MGISKGIILVVDDDRDIAGVIDELLRDEGYAVTILRDRSLESVQATVERLRPDCVLLDGELPGMFGASWDDAAWMTAQVLAVPVIMFSADRAATHEALSLQTERSQAAGFSSILRKPFELDEVLRVIALAVSQSPFRQPSNE
jgi:CheY-like chemotaxis protein